MKKNMILWMSALVLTIAGLSGCSNEDDNAQFQVKNFANTGLYRVSSPQLAA